MAHGVFVRRFLGVKTRAFDYENVSKDFRTDTRAPMVPDRERASLFNDRPTKHRLNFSTVDVPRWQLDRFLGTHRASVAKQIAMPKGRMTPEQERYNIHRPQPSTYGELLGEQ